MKFTKLVRSNKQIKAETYIYDDILNDCEIKTYQAIEFLNELKKSVKKLQKTVNYNNELLNEFTTENEDDKYDRNAWNYENINDILKDTPNIDDIIQELNYFVKTIKQAQKESRKPSDYTMPRNI